MAEKWTLIFFQTKNWNYDSQNTNDIYFVENELEIRVDSKKIYKIVLAVGAGNETEPLGGVKKLDGALHGHNDWFSTNGI